MKHFLAIWLCFISICSFAQEKSKINQFLTPADSLNNKRLKIAGYGTAGAYVGTMAYLNTIWYKDYPRSNFHFYNDSDEWLQMDKVGHAWTSYQGGRWGKAVLQWSGVEEKKATIYGAPLSFAFLTGVEVLDGFSEEWGFSGTDMLANSAGVGLFLGQELLWEEQRIQFKYSLEPVDYLNNPLVDERIKDVYGTGLQSLLKDYNAQTYWLSVNPSMFMDDDTEFPKWLAVSIGYSADGMLGGRLNSWCDDENIKPEDCPYNQRIDFSDQVQRNRQLYLSLDADLTRIETNSELLRTVFGVVNMIKIPAPALEYSDGDFHFRPLR